MLTSSPNADVYGVQAPRVHLLPAEFDEELSRARAEELIDVAAIAGLEFLEWQEIAGATITKVRSDGKWASFEDYVEAPRQNGKTASAGEGLQLAALFAWEVPLQIYTAHEFKTAQEQFIRVRNYIESTPTLDRLVARIRTADGEESIETKSGSRLKFLARSNNSGRGFACDLLYLDEALKLRRQMMAALMPTMAARSVKGNPKMVHLSSAPYADSEVLLKVRERALSGKRGRFSAALWCATPWDELTAAQREHFGARSAYYDDRETWRQSNPSYGYLIDPDYIQAERDSMEDDEFAQERLGIPTSRATAEQVVNPDDWVATATDERNIFADRAFALDISNDRSAAAVAIAGLNDAGELQMEVVEHRRGTHWVLPWLVAMFERNPRAPRRVYVPPGGQAALLEPLLTEAGIEVVILSRADYATGCAAIYDGVTERTLAHRKTGQLALDIAIAGAGWSSGDARTWDRRKATTDISPLVAATVAVRGWQIDKNREVLPDLLGTIA